MISYGGTVYDLGTGTYPSLHDVCVSLSRLWRWNGACFRCWTVLDHSLMMADLAEQRGYGVRKQLAFACHDLSEGCGLSDISFGLKNQPIRALESAIQRLIVCPMLGVDLMDDFEEEDLKEADQLCAHYEKQFLVPGADGKYGEVPVIFRDFYMKYPWSTDPIWHGHTLAVGTLMQRIGGLLRDLHAMPEGSSRTVQQAVPPETAKRPIGTHSRVWATRGSMGRVEVGGAVLWCSTCGTEYVEGTPHRCPEDWTHLH